MFARALLSALSGKPVARASILRGATEGVEFSSVPGPATDRYMLGCKLRSVHSAVPLTERHALSIGVVMTAGRACFGIYADAETLPDADGLRDDLDEAFEELLSAAASP